MTEGDIQRSTMVCATECGSRVFRNNVGMFWTKRGVPVRCGLCTGSSDLIGWRSLMITREMVGTRIAQFVAIEVKTAKGRATPDQKNFMGQVNDAGGCAFIARNDDDVREVLG